jgi:hypothetical protein
MSEAIHHPVVPEFICEYHHRVLSDRGREHVVRVYGISQGTGIWDAWLIFFPEEGGRLLRTDPETEQASLEDLATWAARLTPEYLDDAFQRAHPFREASPEPVFPASP